MGLGIRKVTLLRFKAYLLALYLDPSSLNECKNIDALLDHNIPYTISIVAARESSLSHVRGALERSLKKILSRESDLQSGIATIQIAGLLSCLPTAPIKKGEAVHFTRDLTGPIAVLRQDRPPCIVPDSSWLGNSLLKLYLGQDSVFEDLKATLKESLIAD